METIEMDAQLVLPVNGDGRKAAQAAGLNYIPDLIPGFRRQRRGKGVAYFDEAGTLIRDAHIKSRIEALVIPPAWKDVWISPDPDGHLQATGRDEKGRKQYIYHPNWESARNRSKFDRMLDFSAALPVLREHVAQDMRKRGFPREKVLALLIRLLEYTLIRIGNPEYARRNHSYGLTTLENEHFEVDGSTLIFSFVGKSGIEQEIELRNRSLANQIAQIQELPGQRLFQYVDEFGQPQSIDSGDVNSYLHEISGQTFSAKDFRTWGATTLAALELYSLGPADTKTEQKRKVAEAVRRVAQALGNTPAVSRQYYIHPDILSAYEDGALFIEMQQAALQVEESPFGLSLDEFAVVAILRQRQPNLPTRKE